MAEAFERGHREVDGWGYDWADVGDRFKSSWQSRFGGSDAKWEEYEPRYRYGWEMAGRENYRGKQWNEVEPSLRKDWESRYREQPWDRAGSSIKDAWDNFTGHDWHAEGRTTEMTRTEMTRTEMPRTFELREEVLTPHKARVEAGEVRLRKDVTAEQQTLDVPVTREEVFVERHAVDHRPASGPIGSDSEVIEVPVYEEQATAEKRTFVREEVGLGKRAVQDTERVSGTVRREEAHIEHEGDLHARGTDADFRR